MLFLLWWLPCSITSCYCPQLHHCWYAPNIISNNNNSSLCHHRRTHQCHRQQQQAWPCEAGLTAARRLSARRLARMSSTGDSRNRNCFSRYDLLKILLVCMAKTWKSEFLWFPWAAIYLVFRVRISECYVASCIHALCAHIDDLYMFVLAMH